MGNPTPIEGSFSDVRVIMTIMHVHNHVLMEEFFMLGGDETYFGTRVPIVR
jgi:hypothetical protein